MKKINVLVLTAGGAQALGIINYLKRQKDLPVYIFAADNDSYAAGFFFADEKLLIPNFRAPNFISTLLSLCVKKNIQFIFPPSLVRNEGTDLLSKSSKRFLDKGIKIFVINESSLKCITNKKEMAKVCKINNIPLPRIYPDPTKISLNNFPIFVKPTMGGGGIDTTLIKTSQELKTYLGKEKDYIFQEYIQLPDYTIDFLADFEGRFISAVPRLRQLIKNGQSVQGKTVFDQELVRFTKRICEVFKIDGPGNIQVFKDEKRSNIYLIEINPKFGSSSCLTFESGFNIPLLCIKLAMGLKIQDIDLKYRELSMVRYLSSIY